MQPRDVIEGKIDFWTWFTATGRASRSSDIRLRPEPVCTFCDSACPQSMSYACERRIRIEVIRARKTT